MTTIERIGLIAALFFILGQACTVRAEEQPAAWSNHRAAADWISTALVAGQITADVVHAGAGDHPGDRLGCLALRTGLTVGAAELTKALVSRTRPDGSDRHSFYSEHTALATQAAGWRFQIGIPVAISAGYLRMGANKHYASDVVIGAVVGLLAGRVCR